MYEGVDGLEEFEPDFSEHEFPGDDDISSWEWEDEEIEGEKENERFGDGGYDEHTILIIVIFGVGMVQIIAVIVYYFFIVDNHPPTDKNGRPLTRNQLGHDENDQEL